MTAAAIALCLGMSARTCSRIVRRAGLGRLASLEPAEPVVRYQRERPGELLHVGVKELGRMTAPATGRPAAGGAERAASRCRRGRARPRIPGSDNQPTNGKVERFIQTLTRRWAHGQIYGSSAERLACLPSWLRTYTYLRPHSSLNRQTPAQRLDVLGADNVLASHS